MADFKRRVHELINTGKYLYSSGILPATSGNLSARLSDNLLAITVSGAHKGFLTESDIMLMNIRGESMDGRKSSAETLLHTYMHQRFSSVILIPRLGQI